ncbi:hypothetical protein [Actinoplanes sp. NPDC026670]|uniref:hypothetical protein n=1 Tax=Actinoplanes sp. NPDC026670 TaxID=3154700 RepID=UPI0033C95B42
MVNLAETKRAYQQIVDEWQRMLDGGGLGTAQQLAAAERRLDAVRKSAMRAIDEYTSRRFNSINTRHGLVDKLDRLHSHALTELTSGGRHP